MPNDLWSYRWVILRAILTIPLVLISLFIGFFSKNIKDKLMDNVSNFTWWHY